MKRKELKKSKDSKKKLEKIVRIYSLQKNLLDKKTILKQELKNSNLHLKLLEQRLRKLEKELSLFKKEKAKLTKVISKIKKSISQTEKKYTFLKKEIQNMLSKK